MALVFVFYILTLTRRDGENSVFEKEMQDADVVISQPFWPAYITAERMAKSPNLKVLLTLDVDTILTIRSDVPYCWYRLRPR